MLALVTLLALLESRNRNRAAPNVQRATSGSPAPPALHARERENHLKGATIAVAARAAAR
jgi:hypothetical protein